MKLFEDRGQAAQGPRTHALIIGVGAYPHLLGGDGAVRSPVTMGLGQLTSPVVSATEFAEWVKSSMDNPAAPLDTIELLLSPTKEAAKSRAFPDAPRATMAEIQRAFTDWQDRCDTHPGNIGLFYFSGHGVEPDKFILLPEDFGAKSNPWVNAIDMNETYLAMAGCAARTQCYFIDACREAPEETAKARGVTPVSLLFKENLIPSARTAPFVKAAPEAARAFGLPGEVSYFTSALLDCLKGLGVSQNDGDYWKVDTDSLITALKRRMLRRRLPNGKPMSCDPRGDIGQPVDIHQFQGRARILASIACNPMAATAQASFCARDSHGCEEKRTAPKNERWEIEVLTGPWDVDASFQPACDWNGGSVKGRNAHPPYFEVNVPVTPARASRGRP